MNRIYNIKHLDTFLLGLAIAVLAGGLIVKFGIKKAIEATALTLVFAEWWQDDLEQGTLASLIEEFEDLNPGIKIVPDHRPYSEMKNYLIQGARADILTLDIFWLPEFHRQGVLTSLAPYIEKEPVSQYSAALPEETPYMEALPLIFFMNPLFYNIPKLRAAGFDRPPKNRSEFIHYARTLSRSEPGHFGAALSLSPDYPPGLYEDVFSWLWASGGLTPEGDKNAVPSGPLTETLEFLARLRGEGLLSPESFTKTREQKLDEFINGKIGMMISPVRDITLLRERMGEAAFGITTLPAPDGFIGKPGFGVSGWYAGISAQCAHPDEAWTFLSFLAAKRRFLAEKAHAVPGSGNGYREYLNGDPLYSKAWDMYEAAEGGREFSGFPRFPELAALFREELFALFEEGKNPAAAAQKIQERWAELLEN
jgi:multiple sugar transport system substrate-binding protein